MTTPVRSKYVCGLMLKLSYTDSNGTINDNVLGDSFIKWSVRLVNSA